MLQNVTTQSDKSLQDGADKHEDIGSAGSGQRRKLMLPTL